MDIAQKKLELFRKIDKLPDEEVERFYQHLLALLGGVSRRQKTIKPEIKAALDEALDNSDKGNIFSEEEAKYKTKEKFPSLFKSK